MDNTAHSWPPTWTRADYLEDQHGVVARRQLLAAGHTPADIRRTIRRRELAIVHPGVYVDHTGEPTWLQQAWAAVLFAWPAALGGESALRAHEGPGKRQPAVMEVVVGADRRVIAPAGVRISRVPRLADRVMWNLGPPRLRHDDAAITVAARAATDLAALAVLTDVIQGRRSTAGRLADELDARARSPRRLWLTAVLRDLAEGTTSVLEHAYRERVVHPHGLPTGQSQAPGRSGGRPIYRDELHEHGIAVELDGRLHDATLQRDADMERDLDAALDELGTIRLGWGQVCQRPCETAAKLDRLHKSAGWLGSAHPCGPDCVVGQ